MQWGGLIKPALAVVIWVTFFVIVCENFYSFYLVLGTTKGLTKDIEALKTFKKRTQANLGLTDASDLDINKGLAKDVADLKINVANMPAKIVSGVNALGN